MTVSIIITTLKDNPETLKTIKGLYIDYEVVLAKEKGLGFARNKGFFRSTGDVIIFFDGDLKTNSKIWNILLNVKKGSFIMAYDGLDFGNIPEPVTRVLAINREDFIKVLFNEEIKYSGEDREFYLHAIKKGLKPIYLIPKGFYSHIKHKIRFKENKLIALKMMFEHSKVLVSHGAYTRFYKGFWRWFFPYLFKREKTLRLYLAKIFWSSLRDLFVLINLFNRRYRN